MARVNIEEQAFGDSRLSKLAKLLLRNERATFDDCRHVAMGMLVFLWHGSQEAGRESGSISEIDRWCDFDGAAQLLLDSGYLSNDGEMLVIRGNKEQFASIEEWRLRKSKAGRASVAARTQKYGSSRPRKRDEQNTNTVHQNTNTCSGFDEQDTNTVHQDTNTVHSVHTNRHEQTRTERTQYNSIQYNSLQERKKKEEENTFQQMSTNLDTEKNEVALLPQAQAPKRKVKKKTSIEDCALGTQVFAAYCESMKTKNGWAPNRDVPEARTAKKLVDVYGFDNAMKIAKLYPFVEDEWLTKTQHRFIDILRHGNAIMTQISKGVQITKKVTKEILENNEERNDKKMIEKGYRGRNILLDDDDTLEIGATGVENKLLP